MPIPTPIQVPAEATPHPRRRTRSLRSGAAFLVVIGACALLAATATPAAATFAMGDRGRTAAREQRHADNRSDADTDGTQARPDAPASVVAHLPPPGRAAAALPATPGAVDGIHVTDPPAATPSPDILPPVGTLPALLPGATAGSSSRSVAAVAIFAALLVGSTVLLARRRL